MKHPFTCASFHAKVFFSKSAFALSRAGSKEWPSAVINVLF